MVGPTWGAGRGWGCCGADVGYSKGLRVQWDPFEAQQGDGDAMGPVWGTVRDWQNNGTNVGHSKGSGGSGIHLGHSKGLGGH